MRACAVFSLLLALQACGGDEDPGENEDDDAAGSTADAVAGGDGGSTAAKDTAKGIDTGGSSSGWKPHEDAKVSELKFEAPTTWAQPLKDYHKVGFDKAPNGKFLQGVQDLAIYLDRMYIGYGDANINLGSKSQLAVRYFKSWKSPDTVDEFKHDEEQIDRFRHLGDELWVAGIDATEDGWLGNVYRRTKKDGWKKFRTVGSGVHVHDVARLGADLYAVGSGNTPEGWKEGDIYGFLWRSKDNGKTFEPAAKVWNEGKGDARWTNLLPAGPRLYIFGYKLNNQGKIYNVPNQIWNGKETTNFPPGHALQLALVVNVWPTTDKSGIAIGRDLLKGNNPPMTTWLVTEKGAKAIETFAKETVVDVFKRPKTGEFIFLSRDGEIAPGPAEGTNVKWHVRTTGDLVAFKEVLTFDATTHVQSVAYWHGAIFLGTSLGQVYRSRGSK